MSDYDEMLLPGVAAKALNLNVKTLPRWVREGLIDCVNLPSGHRRYPKAAVDAILAGTYVAPRDRVVG